MSYTDIKEHIEEMYGVEVLEATLSNITDSKINFKSCKGKIALQYALKSLDNKIIKLLLKRGADINLIESNFKAKMLYSACQNENIEIVKLLISV